MPRKSRQRGDQYGPRGKRRGSGRGRLFQTSFEDGVPANGLRIGGMTLHCFNGEVHGMTGRQPRRKGGSRGRNPSFQSTSTLGDGNEHEESEDEAVIDYLQNIAGVDSDENDDGGQDAVALMRSMQSFGEAKLGEGPLVEDGWAGLDQTLDVDSSSGEADTENSSDDSDSDEVSIADIVEDLADGLKLEHAFPYQMKPPQPRLYSAGETSGSGRRPRSFATPGHGGLLPGEKQRLKRAKVEAKRAARAAAKGFDAMSIAMQLDQFVRTQGDIKAFPPMTPYANAFTQKAASLFGLKSSQQGSGRKRFVMVAATQRTQFLDAVERDRLTQLVGSQEAAVRSLNPRTKPSTSGAKQGRNSAGRKSNGARTPVPRFNEPVGFVSSGVVDPFEQQDVVIEPAKCLADSSRDGDCAEPMLAEQPAERPMLDTALNGASPQQHTVSMQTDEVIAVQDMLFTPQGDAAPLHIDMPSEATPPFDLELTMGHIGLGFVSGVSKRSLSDPGSSSRRTVSEGEAEQQQEGSNVATPPLQPGLFSTKSAHKKALKKREKLARRAGRSRLGSHSSQTMLRSVKDEDPQYMVVETNLAFGDFERHTTGFGSRMLAKYGFEGQGAGLGKNSQGRAEPIVAVIRPKQLGLGAGAM